MCAYFEKNRVCIPCYALRNVFHLKNSSSRVEKANDLTVSQRQKHNGMSWSISGSGSIAQIQVHFLREPLKTMRKSAVYEKFAKRERQNPYKSGN